MAVVMTAKQWQDFYADKEFWPEGRYHDDHIVLLNGEPSNVPVAVPEKLDEVDIVTVEYGDVMDATACYVMSLTEYAQSWLSTRPQSTAASKEASLVSTLSELLQVAEGYKEYINALPDDVVAKLPAMPGIDGDWADETMDQAKRLLRGLE